MQTRSSATFAETCALGATMLLHHSGNGVTASPKRDAQEPAWPAMVAEEGSKAAPNQPRGPPLAPQGHGRTPSDGQRRTRFSGPNCAKDSPALTLRFKEAQTAHATAEVSVTRGCMPLSWHTQMHDTSPVWAWVTGRRCFDGTENVDGTGRVGACVRVRLRVCVSACLRQTVMKDGQHESIGPFSELWQRMNGDGRVVLHVERDPAKGGNLSACGAGTSTTNRQTVRVVHARSWLACAHDKHAQRVGGTGVAKFHSRFALGFPRIHAHFSPRLPSCSCPFVPILSPIPPGKLGCKSSPKIFTESAKIMKSFSEHVS